MADDLHITILAAGGFWTTLVLALILVFSSNPQDKKLQNYNRAKYIMAFTYLLFTVFSLFVMNGILQKLDLLALKTSFLMLAIFQVFLFTHINLTLLNYKYFSIKLLIYPLTIVLILFLLIILSYLLNWSGKITHLLFYILLFFHIIAIWAFSYFFSIHYRKYKKRVNNYFTGIGTDRLKWIYISYLLLLVFAIIVIIATFTTPWIVTPFFIWGILFYTGYTIHFLNYKIIFNVMNPVLKEEEEEKPITSSTITFSRIEEAIEKWEQQKLFINPGVTIATVATQINTNRSYLSQYINRSKQKNFNEWINGLRINEAKRLMIAQKNMSVEEISEKVGYTDKSYFSKCFVKYTGITARQWRNNQLQIKE